CNNSACAAFADTLPLDQVAVVTTCESQHCQSTELDAGEVFDSVIESRRSACLVRIVGSHERFLSSEGCLWLEPAGVDSASSARFIIPSFSRGKEVPRGF